MHTDSLKSTARSSKPKGADMRGIQKIKIIQKNMQEECGFCQSPNRISLIW